MGAQRQGLPRALLGIGDLPGHHLDRVTCSELHEDEEARPGAF